MKKQIALLLFINLNVCCYNLSAQPKKYYLDTPTPEEMAMFNKPYIILLNDIEKKLCNDDWGIDSSDSHVGYKAHFHLLKGDPDEEVIERGTTIHNYSPNDLYNLRTKCTVQLKQSSPLFKANNDSMLAQSKITQKQYATGMELYAKAAKNNFKYTAADSTVMKKSKAASDKANSEMAHLANNRQLAVIRMDLNSKWTEPQLGRQYYLDGGTDFDAGKRLPTVDGAAYVTLFMKNPWELDPDTLCEVTIYIGHWPVIPDLKKRFAFHFVHTDKNPWTDKQHSGKPFLENMKINITAENYTRLMDVVHSIDWTKLEALVKK